MFGANVQFRSQIHYIMWIMYIKNQSVIYTDNYFNIYV